MPLFDFTWEKLDGFENCIRMNYQFALFGSNTVMTDNSTDFELIIEDGVFHLNSVGEGYNYVRINDYKE